MTKLGIAVAATLLVAVVDLSGRHDTVGRTEGGYEPSDDFFAVACSRDWRHGGIKRVRIGSVL